ncbi:Ig-like domain-containing protein [Rothia sp. p3-SID1597]|nr:Ig-like domain-containing protein [Rothia sp. p3-SID1597]
MSRNRHEQGVQGFDGNPAEGGATNRMMSRRKAVAGGALGIFSAAFLSACSNDSGNSGSSQSASSSSSSGSASAKPFEPKVTVTPAADAQEVNPVAPVTVTTQQGKMSKVSVEGGNDPVKGNISEDGLTWTSEGPLDFDTSYTVKYTVTEGKSSKDGESTFTTVVAANEADAKINVQQGKTYGTGQVIEFNFSEPVVNRAEIEKAIAVTGGGMGPGRFRWYKDTMVRYRPEDLWAPNSEITIEANLLGKDLGNGQIGNQNYQVTFKTGDKHYAYVDNNTKKMTMYVNDRKVREALVTLGDPEWPSVTGKLVIMEQSKKYKFDASTLGIKKGDPHWYETFEATNTNRLTSSGAFVHQAEPSAYAYVGVANISHGCIGLLPDDAEYFFDTFMVGDVVETENTGYGQADPDNGYGDWNIPWEHYTDTKWKGNW